MSDSHRSAAKSFQDLLVWRKAHELALATYELSKGFPKQEQYALTTQLRRAAVSIPANIAEGFRKRTTAEKLRFYNMAEGSLEEVRYYYILVRDLRYGDCAKELRCLEEVSRLLKAYTRTIILNSDS